MPLRNNTSSQITYHVTVACVYIQFIQSIKSLPGCPYTIYLMDRTSCDLKEKLVERVQIDSSLLTRMILVNSKGLKVMVDDAMV